MNYKIGDKFRIKRYEGICTVGDSPTGWVVGIIPEGEYEIKAITKTVIRFDEEDIRNNWYIVKRNVFDKIAIFEEEPIGVLAGYELLKDTPDTNAGTFVSLDGSYVSTVPFNDSSESLFPIGCLSKTEWFKPIYKPREIRIDGLGRKGISIIVKKGVIAIDGDGNTLDYTKLKARFDEYISKYGDIGNYGLYLLTDVRCLRVGCSAKDHRVSLEEIEKVLIAYEELNGKG